MIGPRLCAFPPTAHAASTADSESVVRRFTVSLRERAAQRLFFSTGDWLKAPFFLLAAAGPVASFVPTLRRCRRSGVCVFRAGPSQVQILLLLWRNQSRTPTTAGRRGDPAVAVVRKMPAMMPRQPLARTKPLYATLAKRVSWPKGGGSRIVVCVARFRSSQRRGRHVAGRVPLHGKPASAGAASCGVRLSSLFPPGGRLAGGLSPSWWHVQ